MDNGSDQPGAFLAEPLTRREAEILSLLAGKLSNREIAKKLTLSLSTVKWYTKQIYSKLGVNSRQSAVDQARSLGQLFKDGAHFVPLAAELIKLVNRSYHFANSLWYADIGRRFFQQAIDDTEGIVVDRADPNPAQLAAMLAAASQLEAAL